MEILNESKNKPNEIWVFEAKYFIIAIRIND